MEIKKLNPIILIIVVIFMFIDPIIMNWLFKIHFFEPLVTATNSLIQPTLLAGIISIFCIFLIVFLIGKHDLKSVWLSKEKMKIAVLPLISIWLISNLVSLLFTYLNTGQISFISNFNFSLGKFIGQIFGNAPFEEIVFRGIFFLQFYLLLKVKVTNKKAIILSVIFSALFFAVVHIPNRLWINKVDNLILETSVLFMAGIGFTIIFIYTQNLAFMIGIHALSNAPFVLFKTSSSIKYFTTYLLIIVITFLWKKITKQKNMISIWNKN
ncbi:MAG: CPBP family intramembrane metalloprotease [Calditrichaeota bacterium]|nr:CPBP family intramembrane metalloprotease [Calditrichota bacterium]